MDLKWNATCQASALAWRRRPSKAQSAHRSCPSCCCSCTFPPPAHWWSPCWVHSACQSGAESVMWSPRWPVVTRISHTRNIFCSGLGATRTCLPAPSGCASVAPAQPCACSRPLHADEAGRIYPPCRCPAWYISVSKMNLHEGGFISLGKQSVTRHFYNLLFKKFERNLIISWCMIWRFLREKKCISFLKSQREKSDI